MTSKIYVACLLTICMLFVLAFRNDQHEQHAYHYPPLPYFPPPLPADNPLTIEGIRLGRFLFYDTILSLKMDISCSSCHKQEHAFSDAPNQFSRGFDNQVLARNTLAIFNLPWQRGLFWDGRASGPEQQVFHPVRTGNEMNLQWNVAVGRVRNSPFYPRLFQAAFGDQPIDSVLIAKAIAQFERTIISNGSKFDLVLQHAATFTHDELEGFLLVNDMTKGDCLHCHPTDGSPLASTYNFSNNGLDSFLTEDGFADKGLASITGKACDVGRFKIPSLRNLGFTAPYMHDGRFSNLDQVLRFYSTGVHSCRNIDSKMEFAYRGGNGLNDDEQRKIIAFLNTLNDSALISNPAYQNPFR